MPSRALSDGSYGIDLCDEAPAAQPAWGWVCSVILPDNRATVQPLPGRGGGCVVLSLPYACNSATLDAVAAPGAISPATRPTGRLRTRRPLESEGGAARSPALPYPLHRRCRLTTMEQALPAIRFAKHILCHLCHRKVSSSRGSPQVHFISSQEVGTVGLVGTVGTGSAGRCSVVARSCRCPVWQPIPKSPNPGPTFRYMPIACARDGLSCRRGTICTEDTSPPRPISRRDKPHTDQNRNRPWFGSPTPRP